MSYARVWLTVFSLATVVLCDYWQQRAVFLESDENVAIGATLPLSQKETKVNKIVSDYKVREYDDGFRNPQDFLAGQHFFKAKPKIEQSKVFKILQKLPKGASLHSHDLGLVSGEYLYNLTYRDNLYATFTDDGVLKLRFFNPETVPGIENWQKVSWFRKYNSSFDSFLKSQMTMVTDDPLKAYPVSHVAWRKFQNIFTTILDLVCYREVFEEYFYQALKELHEDNVMYLEFRGVLPAVYELDGRVYGPLEVAAIYVKVLGEFMSDYPDFLGAKFIYAPMRHVRNITVVEYVETYKNLKQIFPDFIAGFDLVGEEDMGRSLEEFIPEILKLPADTKFFFHAGETDWNGESVDLNLVDAVLLNSTRIGHAYAIVKHPEVARQVRERDIAIEIVPISNQVLKLVDDMRNHPGSMLVAFGYPVVISCDDPGLWGTKALSYDWYYAFMGLASKNADLRFLKQLAMNSLMYSALKNSEKKKALKKWEKKWEEFLDEMLAVDRNVLMKDSDFSDCDFGTLNRVSFR